MNMKYIDIDYSCKTLNINDKINCHFNYFNNKEIEFELDEDIKNSEVNIYQRFKIDTANISLIKLSLCCNVLKNNNIVIANYFSPFLPYTRQDKIYNTKKSLGIELVANIISLCKIKCVTTYDLHSKQIIKLLPCKINNLSAIPFFMKDIEERYSSLKNDYNSKNDLIIVLPDEGAIVRFKKLLDEKKLYKIVTIDKKLLTTEAGIKKVYSSLPDLKNKIIVIIDDIIDSGKTIINTANFFSKYCNIKTVDVYATHGVFSGDSIENINNSKNISQVTITDSIKYDSLPSKFKVIHIPTWE